MADRPRRGPNLARGHARRPWPAGVGGRVAACGRPETWAAVDPTSCTCTDAWYEAGGAFRPSPFSARYHAGPPSSSAVPLADVHGFHRGLSMDGSSKMRHHRPLAGALAPRDLRSLSLCLAPPITTAARATLHPRQRPRGRPALAPRVLAARRRGALLLSGSWRLIRLRRADAASAEAPMVAARCITIMRRAAASTARSQPPMYSWRRCALTLNARTW